MRQINRNLKWLGSALSLADDRVHPLSDTRFIPASCSQGVWLRLTTDQPRILNWIMSVNTLCWTDIPVGDLERAITFYSAVLGKRVDEISE